MKSPNLNVLQESIQSKLNGHKDLKQFKVRVSQNLDVEWKPSCSDLTGDMGTLRADGNCLCYALYEAYGREETLVPVEGEGEAISVRNLRKHIVTAQVNELRQRCTNISQMIGDSLEKRKKNIGKVIYRILDQNIETEAEVYGENFNRVALFQGLNGNEANIQAAVNYIKEQRISSRHDISNPHLSNILIRLGMPENSQFITEYLNSEAPKAIELKCLSVVESPTEEDLLIALCDGLIGIKREGCFENQQEIDCDRLLNSVQQLLNMNLSIEEEDMSKLICNTYNTKAQNNPIILENDLPTSEVQKLIKLALETVKTNKLNSQIHNDCLPHVMQMLQRPILLIYENCKLRNGRMVNGNEEGKVCNCTLHTLGNQLWEYSVDGEGRLLPNEQTGNTPQFSEVSTDDMITIAMHPGHYYGIPSFADNNLHIGNRRVTGVNQEGLILQPPAQFRMFHPQNVGSDKLYGGPSETITQPVEISEEINQNITNLCNTLAEGIQGTEICNDLSEKLTHFAQFITYLQRVGKDLQVRAEVKNLQHIQSCAEEMLKENGLNFKPEFVAKIVCERLRMAMFGSDKLDDTSEDANMGSINVGISDEGGSRYQPSCMWDFGKERTVIPLQNDDFGIAEYMNDGILGSPKRSENGRGHKKKVNSFSVLRGDSNKKGYYTMEDGQPTPSLQIRFQQYLRFISREFSPDCVSDDVIENFLSRPSNDIDERNKAFFAKFLKEFSSFINDDWKGLSKMTSLNELPPALMISIGLQFGQIRQGTWNPFAVAAKKYFALQSGDGKFDRFTWKDELPEEKQDTEDVASCAFGSLFQYIWPEGSFKGPEIIQQFEKGLCAYYAMTQEVLSRTNFPGNNMGNCRTGSIFRLEDVEAIETMGVVIGDKNTYSMGRSNLSTAKRPVFASTSAVAHLASLDHPNDFPPPIKIITKYSNVHHARIFGCHLFNVDSGYAARPLGSLLPKSREPSGRGVGTYNKGCPFFNDYQRECLTMLNGLNFEIVGILAAAIDQGETYVLAGNNWEKLLTAKYTEIDEAAFETEEQPGKKYSPNWRKIKGQVKFCLEDNMESMRGIIQEYSKKASMKDNRLDKLHGIIRTLVKSFNFKKVLKREKAKKS
ncbi:MAG: hypothetical protein LBF94_02775 [Puniceicoccales bacterium]|nr:hypothetical protein [Puniceicoccales bacterium]